MILAMHAWNGILCERAGDNEVISTWRVTRSDNYAIMIDTIFLFYTSQCVSRDRLEVPDVFSIFEIMINKNQQQKPLTCSVKGSISVFWCNNNRPQVRSVCILIFVFSISCPVLRNVSWKKQAFGSWTSYKE